MQDKRKPMRGQNIPFIAFESVQARNERIVRRLWILCAISAVVVAIESISLLVRAER